MEDSLQTVDVREKKKEIAEAVQKAFQLESEEAEARQNAKQCFANAERLREKVEKNYGSDPVPKDVETLRSMQNLLDYRKRFLEKPKEPTLFGNIMVAFFVGLLFLAFVGTIISCIIMAGILDNFDITKMWIVAVVIEVISIIVGICSLPNDKKTYQKNLQEYPQLIIEEERKLAEYKAKNFPIEELKKKGKDLTERAEKLEAEKQAFYESSMIPPDYRRLECLEVFSYAFRNDLVDDMRGAVHYYEEKRKERELENIHKAMNQLKEENRALRSKLSDIAYETERIAEQQRQEYYEQQLHKQ